MDLPDSAAFTVEDFVKMQEKHIAKQSTALQGMCFFNCAISYDLIKLTLLLLAMLCRALQGSVWLCTVLLTFVILRTLLR